MQRRILFFMVICLWVLTACGGQATPPPAPTPTPEPIKLKFMTHVAVFELNKTLLPQFTAETGIQVEQVVGPESGNDRLAKYLEYGKAQSTEFDVFQIDVVWPGILEQYMADLTPYLANEAKSHFPAIVENNTREGKLIAMPYYTDAGLLYYRKDLLEKYGYSQPPQTWVELTEMATKIQAGERAEGNKEFWGFVWQGAAYEGLTCNALEWQVSLGGGRIIEPNGLITVNNPQTIAALNQAKSWLGTISPEGVLGFKEEDARSVWHAGNAAFMRNWPYAFARGQVADAVIKDKFAVTLLPSGGKRHASTLGGWQLAVSKFSKHPKEAAMLVEFMTRATTQAERSIKTARLPTIPELYSDKGVLAANPFYADLKDVFLGGAVARPSTVSGDKYDQVSTAYFTMVHDVLTGQVDAAEAVPKLEAELVKITNLKTGQPE